MHFGRMSVSMIRSRRLREAMHEMGILRSITLTSNEIPFVALLRIQK